jgi:hypothetical protein
MAEAKVFAENILDELMSSDAAHSQSKSWENFKALMNGEPLAERPEEFRSHAIKCVAGPAAERRLMVERRGYRRDEDTCFADWDDVISWASASATHARVGGLQGSALSPIADESLHRSETTRCASSRHSWQSNQCNDHRNIIQLLLAKPSSF